jgi:glycosyltransferase involved in cell wall biosynthesis
MACGVPVLSSNASSLPEVVDSQGEAAILLPPGDEIAWSETIRSVLSDKDKRSRMINAGLQRVNYFSWQQAAKNLLQLYQSLLSG